MLVSKKHLYYLSAGLIASFSLLLIAEAGYAAKKDKKKDSFVMTEAELQSRVMGFTDRFAAIIGQAIEDYDAQSPPSGNRRIVVGDTAFALASAFTIAAEADPDTALLDMLVMVTLGRMLYEEHWQKKWGSQILPMFYAYRKAELDIWEIASIILSPERQRELRQIIREWRQNNPEITTFFQIRFSDFAAERRKSKLSRAKKGGGVFKSVEVATQQVEEMRLLAERGMFLATRMPLLTGLFADTWLSQLIINPDVKEMLADIHQFSAVSERLATVAEWLPDNIAKERQKAIRQVMKEVETLSQTTVDRVMAKVENERSAAIKQFVEEFSNERKKVIEDFLAEEERFKGVLTDLRNTLSSGNDLLVTTNSLLTKLDIGAPSDTPSEPFDIKDYRDTVAEVSNTARELTTLVNSTNQLVTTVGLEKLLPQIAEAIDQAEDEGRKMIDHSFRQAVLLIIIWMVAYILARTIINYITKRRTPTVADIQS
jgi:uncharacterized membrane protein